MKVFVTGATGFVGRAVVGELIGAGHSVVGLARSDAAAAALRGAGAEPLRGDLEDLDALGRGAAQSDGVIHAGFIHDFARFQENSDIDATAIAALGVALAGSGRPLIVTSGTGMLDPGGIATEEAAPQGATPRRSEQALEPFAGRGVRTMALRLPQVHGPNDHGFTRVLIDLAREKGVSAYVGDGSNRWPAVHVLDAARLYRLALEKGRSGARYHAVADEGVATRQMAQIIGRRVGVPVVSKTPAEAMEHFGWFGMFASMDNRASSGRTQAELGWRPREHGLIEDLDSDVYFPE